jgi:hypothetical protein
LSRITFWQGLLALVALSLAVFTGSASAATHGGKPDGYAKSTTVGGVDPQFLPGARTIPHFTFQYTDPASGRTYPITMVGSDPRKAGGDTTVHTVIVPLKLHFSAAGQDTSVLDDQGYTGFRATPLDRTFDGTTKVSRILASPMFSSSRYDADLGGDTGQNGDVFMRAQFNKIGSGYHVRLVNDGVTATQSIDVPANKGIAYQRPVGAWRTAQGTPTDTVAGIANDAWFSSKIQNLISSLHIDGTVAPIFLTDNVMLYGANYADCCTIGYHGAAMPIGHGAGGANGNGNQPVNTFMFSAYTKPGTYSGFMSDYTGTRTSPAPTRGLSDIHALSHEVSEWLDDPFVNNAVDPWVTPTAPQYGCTPVLETGDPVVGVWYPLAGNTDAAAGGVWHPEEEVFAQWFGHGGVEAAGLRSWDGRLTFMGPRTTGLGGAYADFGTYSHGC